jgi:hypothetical protein
LGKTGVAARYRPSETQAVRAFCSIGHCPIACSTGASARPSMIELATIAPAVIWFCSTR